jgi:hypothetical protein
MKINARFETLKELKEALKEAAVEIRNKKAKRKGSPYGRVAGLDDLRYQARHHHLAYCMLRVTDRYAVEAKCGEDNKPVLVAIQALTLGAFTECPFLLALYLVV